MTTGKVRDGTIRVEGEALPEGSTVTVITADDEDAFELAPDEEAALVAAIDEADRGQTVDACNIRELLRRR